MGEVNKKLGIREFFECVQALCYAPRWIPVKVKKTAEKTAEETNYGDANPPKGGELANLSSEEIGQLLAGNLLAENTQVRGDMQKYYNICTNSSSDSSQDSSSKLIQLRLNEDYIAPRLISSLSQSLLSGEYLYDDKYSKILLDIIELIEKTYLGEEQKIHNIHLHPILGSIYKLCLDLREICELTKMQIDCSSSDTECDDKMGVFCMHETGIALPDVYQYKQSRESELYTRYFEELMPAVVRMTHIDISGTMKREDIKSLQKLYEYARSLEKLQLFEKKVQLFEDSNCLSSVFRAIKAKASLLIAQAFYKPQGSDRDLDELFRNKDNEHKDGEEQPSLSPYHKTKNTVYLYRGKGYIDLPDGKQSLYALLVRFRKEKSDDEPRLGAFRGLKRKEEPDTSAWKLRGYTQKYIQFLAKEEGKCARALELKSHFSLLKDLEGSRAILDTEKDTEKVSSAYQDFVDNLGELKKRLDYITEYLSRYSLYIPQGIRRGKIEDCLFSIDDQVDVFIASYGTPPVFVDLLQDEVYPKLNSEYKMGSLRLLRATSEQSKILLENTQKLSKETKEKDLQYISILGVFASIIVFVMSTITIFKEANTILEFLSVLFAGFGLTALFLFFFNPQEKNSPPLLRTILASIGLAVLIACFDYFSDKEPATSGSVHLNMSVEGAISPSGKSSSAEQSRSNAALPVDSSKSAKEPSKLPKDSIKS